MPSQATAYIPALRYHWLTRLYDPVVRSTTREATFKRRLVDQVAARPGYRILDVGCGTGTLAIQLKRACPGAMVLGIDADPAVLGRARSKAAAAGADVTLCRGLATEPPFSPGTFDRIVSSLLFHHLTTADKRRALVRARELLVAGGELHVADWGKPHGPVMRAAYLGVQLLDGFSTTADNVAGRLIPLMEDAGFDAVVETGRLRTVWGTLSLYRAARAPSG